MDRPRVYRGLRIAMSAVCLIVCGLLVALWVRSYWWIDEANIRITDTQGLDLILIHGGVRLVVRYNLVNPYPTLGDWQTWYFDELEFLSIIPDLLDGHRINWGADSRIQFDDAYVLAPYWLLIAVTAALAAVSWIRWRFSLRTLLIATTVITVVLGLAVWSSS